MATKQLSVVGEFIDRITGPLNAPIGALMKLNERIDQIKAVSTGRFQQLGAQVSGLVSRITAPVTSLVSSVTSGIKRIVDGLLSVQSILAGFIVVRVAQTAFGWIKGTIDDLDEFAERSRAVGMSAEQLSLWEYAGKKVQVSAEDMNRAFIKATENLGEFEATGGGPASVLVERLGISLRDTTGRVRGISELLPVIAAGTREWNQEARQALYQDFFGRTGKSIERLTQNGLFEQAAAEARKYGAVITQSQVEAAQRAADAIDRISGAWAGLKRSFVEVVADPITMALDAISQQMAKLPDLVRGLVADLRVATSGVGSISEVNGSRERLANIGTQAVNVLTTSAIALGKVIGGTVIETMYRGFQLIMPSVSDLVKKLLNETLFVYLNQIPFVNITPFKLIKEDAEKAREALDAYEQQAREAQGLQARRSELQRSLDRIPKLTGNLILDDADAPRAYKMVDEIQEIDRRLDEMKKKINGRDWATLMKDVIDTSSAVANQDAQRIRDLWSGIAEGAMTVSELSKQQFADVRSALQELGVLVDAYVVKARALRESAADFVGPKIDPELLEYRNKQEEARRTSTEAVMGYAAVVQRNVQAITTGWLKIPEVIRTVAAKLQAIDLGWRVRELRAQGRDSEGSRLELLGKQQTELAETMKEYGGAASAATQRIRALHAAELARFDVMERLKALTETGQRAEAAYNDQLRQIETEQSVGLLNTGLARANQVNALRDYIDKLKDVRGQYRAIVDVNPFDETARRQLEDTVEKINNLGASLRRAEDAADTGNAFKGVLAALQELKDKADDVRQFTKGLVLDIGESLSSGIGTALTDAISGTQSFGRAFASMAQSVLRQISEMIFRFLALRAVMSIIGAVSGGGAPEGVSTDLFNSGGTSADFSGVLGGNFGKRTLAAASIGVAAAGSAYLAPRASAAPVAITVNVSHSGSVAKGEGERVGKAIASQLMQELERSPDLRQRMKGFTS